MYIKVDEFLRFKEEISCSKFHVKSESFSKKVFNKNLKISFQIIQIINKI